MDGNESSEESRALSSTCALDSDIIRTAVAEASRISLDAVKAAELMYGEIVKAAQSQAERILADARQEAQRILAEAESQTTREDGNDQDTPGAEDALEILRLELASMVRQLRGNVEIGMTHIETPPAASRPADDTVVSGNLGSEAPTTQSRVKSSHGPQSPDQLSPDGLGIRQSQPGNPQGSAGLSWQPPEWMSSQN